jgi:hypothetical protein
LTPGEPYREDDKRMATVTGMWEWQLFLTLSLDHPLAALSECIAYPSCQCTKAFDSPLLLFIEMHAEPSVHTATVFGNTCRYLFIPQSH